MPAHILDHFPSDSQRLDSFREALLAWYDNHKRKLPWRSKPSLYKTVVSEFMLQQTRVATVLPYFERWMNLFPDFSILADASEEQVLKAWEGLGYYSRARNLHKLARQVDSWDTIPADSKSWQALPGIGPYVAAAVTSISFGQAEAVCDGNVVRVLTRLFANDELFKDGATAQKKLRPLASQLLDGSRPGDYNQAMMELGATVCHRQSPLCLNCPVIDHCKGGKTGDTERYPNLAKKKNSKQKIRRYWIRSRDGLLLCSAAKGSARLAGIYELPENLPVHLKKLAHEAKHLATRKRTIGQVDYDEEIFKTEILESTKNTLPDGYRWVLWTELDALTLSGPHRKWIKELSDET
ncbi:MAG: A/G-specific adenine glycosylase [Opitutae bacterium]|nr:A/G-specific adenine glycosylase [Opitutae bacterium]